jgi:hypothetical protein
VEKLIIQAGVIEISADVVNEVRVGLDGLLAARSIPSRREERARALLDVAGSEAGPAPARLETLGDSEEDDRLLWMLCDVIDTIDRRADSTWIDGEGDW